MRNLSVMEQKQVVGGRYTYKVYYIDGTLIYKGFSESAAWSAPEEYGKRGSYTLMRIDEDGNVTEWYPWVD